MAIRRLAVTALAVLLGACGGGPARYTSQDIALLPCETGASPVFFHPLEFTADGAPALGDEQVRRIRERLGPEMTDIVVFVHGWNKNPSLAERDFSDFLCRLHGHVRGVAQERNLWLESEKGQRLLVIGVFWPSTVLANARDPLLLKPPSYFRMRSRVDAIAARGFPAFLMTLVESLRRPANLHLVGHSFGGRMIVHGLQHLSAEGKLPRLLERAAGVNVVLLNGALPADDFRWLLRAVAARPDSRSTRFSLASDSGLYNVHSFHDSANRYLFPLASAFNPDPSACAAGACGVPELTTLCVDGAGRLPRTPPGGTGRRPTATDLLAAWNVDATPVVFDHSDIYKGRVARLVVDLLFRADRASLAAVGRGGETPTADRCPGP